jgi:hypothetical protein
MVVVKGDDLCPMHWIVSRLTPDGRRRLQRCREADCGLLHRVHDQITCTGCGKPCEQLSNWARLLNGEDDCPHWVSDPSLPDAV